MILGISLLFIGGSDVTDTNLTADNQAIEPNAVETSMHNEKGNTTEDTILDIAASDENFSILAQAVLFAGLDGALAGKRQLTVFAPTNDAFAKLLS